MINTANKCLNPDCPYPIPAGVKFCQQCGTKLLLMERYRAVKMIGQGGFGRTFLAVDEQKPSKPSCVIKQFYPQAQGTNNADKAKELFEQESIRLDELGKHSQIPELLAYFTQDNRQYLVQEFIDGENLGQELDKEGCFNETKIKQLLLDLLPILEFIHAGQVIHRDIKPENIIRRHSDKKLVLVDFGAAKFATDTALLKTGTRIGSAEYAAPEQARGKAVFASDLYSLGVTCVHLLTQISPFDLFDIHEDVWVWRDYLVNNPVSTEMGKILDKLIQNVIRNRYQSATEVLELLRGKPQAPKPDPIISVVIPTNPVISVVSTDMMSKFEFDIVSLNHQGKEINRRRGQAELWKEDLGNGIFIEMVSIPGGSFIMGSPDTEKERLSYEGPQHQVKIAPFLMGRTPVTQAQWKAVAALPQINRPLDPDPSCFKGANRPVECVSWEDCEEFCQRLAEKTKRSYSLPSESQWEYACRAGTTTPFHFGETISTEVTNYDGNFVYGSGQKGKYREETTPVDTFKVANAFGLTDMHGNVWEWCKDDWHENYNNAPSDGSAWQTGETYRLLRGGAWDGNPWVCRSAFRNRDSPDSRSLGIGFRLVVSSAWTL